MIKISELQEYHKAFRLRQEIARGGVEEIENEKRAIDEILEFIGFIEKEQNQKKKVSVTPYELREGMRRLKELEERQKENKRVTPESDFEEIE